MHIKNKKTWAIIVIAYYVCFFFFKTMLSEHILLYPKKYQISEHCIIVEGEASTGPEIRVVEGAGFLLNAIPGPHSIDLNVNEIELSGVSIFDNILSYPDYYLYEWLIYGDVVGMSDLYEDCGSGTIPVFKCKKAYPIMTLSDFLSLEIIIFSNFPAGLIITLVMYCWPAIGWLSIVLLKGRQKAQVK